MALSMGTVVVSPISPSVALYGTSLNALALGPQCYKRLRTYLVNIEDVGFGAGIFPCIDALSLLPPSRGTVLGVYPYILYSGGSCM